MVTLPENTFHRVKNSFYAQVLALPVKMYLLKEELSPASNDEYQSFMSTQKETFSFAYVNCLYQRSITNRERSKYGLKQDITAMVYIPPQVLIGLFGTWLLQHTKLIFWHVDYVANNFYEVDSVMYMEPLYNSCISVRYHLKNCSKNIDINTLASNQQLVPNSSGTGGGGSGIGGTPNPIIPSVNMAFSITGNDFYFNGLRHPAIYQDSRLTNKTVLVFCESVNRFLRTSEFSYILGGINITLPGFDALDNPTQTLQIFITGTQ